MDDRKLQEMIDACRPGSTDIDLPEVSPLTERLGADPKLRRRYKRSQQLDARLVRAIDDVEVPAGLRERILERLVEEGRGARGEGREESGAPEMVAVATPDEAAPAPAPASRRRWLFSFAAVAAGLVLAITGYAVWPHHAPLTKESVLNLSGQWYEWLREHAAWQPLGPREAIRDFPLADAIRPRPQKWTDATPTVGSAACAYDLTAPGGPRATLFVLADDDQIADSTLPLKPDSSTGGLMIGCWQSGQYVYVLIVEGNEPAYRNMLDGAGPPLAEIWPVSWPPLARIIHVPSTVIRKCFATMRLERSSPKHRAKRCDAAASHKPDALAKEIPQLDASSRPPSLALQACINNPG